MGSRLVLLAGRAAVGKTTLSTALAQVLPDAAFVPELVFFDVPELADIGDAFRRKEYPGPELLLDGWSRILAANRRATWIVHDGCWVPLGEDLPWATSDAVVDFARRMFEISSAFDPLVFFLHGEDEQIAPRIEARGREVPPAGDAEAWSDKIRRILATVDADVVDLDATRPADAVLRDALAALGVA